MEISTLLKTFEADMRLIRYAESSIENYVSQLRIFLNTYKLKDSPKHISADDIKEYLLKSNCINSQKHAHSAIKLFYSITVKQPQKLKYIKYPRKEQKLPQPLSEQEVKLLFEHCSNKKHKSILSLLFFCGMRVGEVLNLKPEHIDRGNMVIKVMAGKGKKDRIVPMSESVLRLLESYYREYKPKTYIYNGQFGEQYSDRSVNQFIKDIGAKAGIKKRLHSHLGRHSCFSQMLANGIDMAVIQSVAGHENINTTRIYAKVTSSLINRTTPYAFAL
jgi:integrase/recombinase XerD